MNLNKFQIKPTFNTNLLITPTLVYKSPYSKYLGFYKQKWLYESLARVSIYL